MTSLSLAQPSDAQTGALQYLFRDVDSNILAADLAVASRTVEQMVTGRLLPFTTTEDVLARRRSNGSGRFGRIAWVAERPTARPELWTGTVTSVSVFDYTTPNVMTPIDVTTVDFTPSQGRLRFPDPGSNIYAGIEWLGARLGPATQWGQGDQDISIRVTYTGGYQPGSVPEDIVRATVIAAAKERMRNTKNGESREGAYDLQAQLADVLAGWTAGRGSFIG